MSTGLLVLARERFHHFVLSNKSGKLHGNRDGREHMIATLRAPAALAAACLVVASASATAGADRSTWVEAYAMSPAGYDVIPAPPGLPKEMAKMFDQTPVRGTLRSRFAVSAGGSRLRVRISNEEGATPLRIDGASIAHAVGAMDAAPGTMRRLTFSGETFVVIPAGAPVLSDPVDLPVKAFDELIASVFLDENQPAKPRSGVVMLKTEGNEVMADRLHEGQQQYYRPPVSAVLVEVTRPTRVIVAFGDSITDAGRATPEEPHGWTDRLGHLLANRKAPSDYAVISAGIGGNRMLDSGWGASALARADRDVFSVPGVSDVILLEGINDINFGGKTILGEHPNIDIKALENAYEQIAVRAHALGLRIYIGTLTPSGGSIFQSEFRERQRQSVNAWIRTNKVFDAVIDFEAAVRDPMHPGQLRPEFDSGDHLHPSAAGYAAMANAIELRLFP